MTNNIRSDSPLDEQTSALLWQKLETAYSCHQQGRLSDAGKAYQEILSVDHDHFHATNLLGVIAAQTGQYQQALELFSAAIRIDPEAPDAHSNRGNVLRQLGRPDEALASYDQAIGLNPSHADSHSNRGNALRELRRFDEALASYDQAIALNPNHAVAYSNRGVVLHRLERLDEALASFDQAIALNPQFPESYSNRGYTLQELGRFEDALKDIDQAIALNPAYADACSNRGNALTALNRFGEALASYDRAIALKPDYPEAHFNRGLLLLLNGNFDLGWVDYEWRKLTEEPLGDRALPKPLWLGEQALSGKTILVHDEQALGDTIQFCRYVGRLNSLGGRVLFAPRARLKALMGSLAGEFELVDVADPSLDYDVHCPLLSLPLAFRTSLDTIADRVPYLRADPLRIDRWQSRLGRDGLKIGICWQGSTAKVDFGRSFPVTEFLGVARLPGVRLISLHKGVGEAQLAQLPDGMVIETPGDDFDAGPDAFLDTAAVMKCCDLVITSDTAIAHLAGALAVPTWVALKQVPDWRWLLARADSPWYPTMRLFRQTAPGDWAGVFAEIERELKLLPESRTPQR